jgi:hypothetical protein
MGDRESTRNEKSALEKDAYFTEHMDYLFLCPQGATEYTDYGKLRGYPAA